MKARLLSILGVLIIFSACQSDSKSSYTPYIGLFSITLNGDTLHFKDVPGEIVLNTTLQVGDTLKVHVIADGYANNLTDFVIQNSQDSVFKIVIPPKDSIKIYPKRDDIETIFASDTKDYNKGIFVFDGELRVIDFTFLYIAKKASKDAHLACGVKSDADFDYNTNSFSILTIIEDRKD